MLIRVHKTMKVDKSWCSDERDSCDSHEPSSWLDRGLQLLNLITMAIKYTVILIEALSKLRSYKSKK